MKCIADLPKSELTGKRMLVRAGLDVPLDEHGEVADMYRVKRASETLAFLSRAGAKVIVLSHIGRDPKLTNEPVARALSKFVNVTYVPNLTGMIAQGAIKTMRDGEVLILENLRTDAREEENDESFARALASLGELYVDDAFSVAHRAHASIVGIPKFLPSYAGILMRDEVTHLDAARSPQSPSFAILGGAKFETKAPLIKTLLDSYDHLFLTGALANDAFKAKGFEVGTSLISKMLPGPEVLEHPRFIAPIDVTIERPDGQVKVCKPDAVGSDERIVDIGPDTVALVAPFIVEAKNILWNGPTGIYEQGFIHLTHAIAELVERSDAHSVVGGGDTVAAIEESGIEIRDNTFLSTGGGAMLDYLLDGTLPGIAALN